MRIFALASTSAAIAGAAWLFRRTVGRPSGLPRADMREDAAAGDPAPQADAERVLERGVADRTRELAVLVDASRNVASTIDLQRLVRIILEQVRAVAPYDRASFMLRDGDELRVLEADLREGDDLAAHAELRFQITRDPPLWEIMRRGEPVIIEDVRGDTPLARAYQAAVGRRIETTFAGNRAWLGIPLMLRDRVIAVLALSREEPNTFEERQARLATAIAGQAAFAVENARLFEQEAQRTQELATLLEVARHVGETIELRPLARLILEETAAVIDYDRSTFMLAVDGQLEAVAVRAADGRPDPGLLGQIGERHPIGGPPLIWEPLLTGGVVIVDDTHADTPIAAAYRQATGAAHIARSQGRSWMAVPLLLQGRLNGTLLMTKRTPGFFTARHAELALAIASQAAVGIENAHLFERAEQRTRELTTLLDVSHAVASTLELRQLVELILDQLESVTQYTGASLLMSEGDSFVIFDSRGHGAREPDAIGVRLPIPRDGGWWSAMHGRDSVIIDNVRDASPAAVVFRELLGPELESPAFCYVRSWLSVRLRTQDRVVGMLSLSHDTPGYFTEQHARLALSIADQAALAIENARLYERVQTTAALEERQRLARELHDSVSQALYGIGLGARTAKAVLERDPARAAEPIDYVLSLAEAGLTEMRALIFELRPESLETEGLVAALEKQVSATSARYGVAVDAQLCAEPAAALDAKEAIYRIAQEALHNTVKHAHATAIELRLTCDDGTLVLHVHDDGVGFDPGGDFPGHLGLTSMRERITRLRGTLDITSAPGEGTRIHARVPL